MIILYFSTTEYSCSSERKEIQFRFNTLLHEHPCTHLVALEEEEAVVKTSELLLNDAVVPTWCLWSCCWRQLYKDRFSRKIDSQRIGLPEELFY